MKPTALFELRQERKVSDIACGVADLSIHPGRDGGVSRPRGCCASGGAEWILAGLKCASGGIHLQAPCVASAVSAFCPRAWEISGACSLVPGMASAFVHFPLGLAALKTDEVPKCMAGWSQGANLTVTAQHPSFQFIRAGKSKLAEGDEEMGASSCMFEGCVTVLPVGPSPPSGEASNEHIVSGVLGAHGRHAWARRRCAVCVAGFHA